MQRFFAAAAYSFLVVAAVLFWEAYRVTEIIGGDLGHYRSRMYTAEAIVFVILGFIGMRQRHRRQEMADPHDHPADSTQTGAAPDHNPKWEDHAG